MKNKLNEYDINRIVKKIINEDIDRTKMLEIVDDVINRLKEHGMEYYRELDSLNFKYPTERYKKPKPYLDEILFDFSKFTNFKFNYRINTNYTNYPALYLNETLKNDIQTYLNSKKRLRLIGSSRIAVTIDGESLGFWTEFDSDRIFIWNEFEPNSGVAYDLMSKEIISEDLSECIDQYLKIIESDSTYLESDEVYQGLDSILEEHPLISTDWVALVYHTGFTNL